MLFQQRLKVSLVVKNMKTEVEIINESKLAFEDILGPLPFVNSSNFQIEVKLDNNRRADFVASLDVEGRKIKLIGEVKRNLQPRYVLDAVRQVKEYCSYIIGEPVYPVVVSEYISPRSAEILINENVSYFDLTGNCRLSFANVYIEKEAKASKVVEKRGIKSLFGLKSSRMLRLMLNGPMRPWHVKELSERTELSFGQVSNIRRALLDQKFAIESEEGGIHIDQPGALLEQWKWVYKKNVINNQSSYYTLLPTEDRLDAVKSAMDEANKQGAGIMLSGVSSAKWLAPFVKSSSEYFYADKSGIELLKKHLELEAVAVGPNVIIDEPKDSFLFKEAIDCAPELKCANAVQTYLDLYVSGEREKEAAEYLQSHLLREQWKNN